MQITAIEPRRKSLRALYLDGEYAASIDARVLAESPYRVGDEVSPEQIEELANRSEARRAQEKALYLLECRDHSRKELENKLRRSVKADTDRQVTQRMEEAGLINDRDFAGRYARELMQRKGYAVARVEQALRQKGIDRELIREIIEEMQPDPQEQLADLIEKKFAAQLADEKGRKRAVAALLRLGYRWEDVRSALQPYLDADEGWQE